MFRKCLKTVWKPDHLKCHPKCGNAGMPQCIGIEPPVLSRERNAAIRCAQTACYSEALQVYKWLTCNGIPYPSRIPRKLWEPLLVWLNDLARRKHTFIFVHYSERPLTPANARKYWEYNEVIIKRKKNENTETKFSAMRGTRKIEKTIEVWCPNGS